MEYPWYALIEENDGYYWRVTELVPLPAGVATEDLARRVAFRFKPKRPALPQRRTVYRIDDHSFIVRIQGATSVHHFRVTLAEQVAELDADGNPTNPDDLERAD